MTSKYGNQLYGKDLYSSALTLFQGAALSFASAPAGRLTESEPFVSALSYAVTFAGRLTESEPFTSDFIQIDFTFVGRLRETSGLRSDLFVPVDIQGNLKRSHTERFVGTLPFSVVPQGRLQIEWHVQAPGLTFEVLIGGGADIYIGPFWDPDEPVEGGWVPIGPSEGFWVPDVPVQAGWTPIPQEREL